MTWTESWESQDLAALENASKLRSFAMDPAWAEAAASSGYATPLRLGLVERGSLPDSSPGSRTGSTCSSPGPVFHVHATAGGSEPRIRISTMAIPAKNQIRTITSASPWA